jgi:hypothetical protein
MRVVIGPFLADNADEDRAGCSLLDGAGDQLVAGSCNQAQIVFCIRVRDDLTDNMADKSACAAKLRNERSGLLIVHQRSL